MQTGAHGVLQKRQTLAHKGAVFAHKGHHIGNRAESDQLAVHFQQLAGVAALQRGAQLKGNARAAQILKGTFVIGAFGVNDGYGIGQGVAGQVVVGDDKIQPQCLGAGGFLHGRNAVVHRHDQLEPLLGKAFQRRAGQTVAVAARGQLAAHVCAHAAQALVQDGGGGDAVHIVVTVDDDQLLVLDRLLNARDRLVHIPHKKRVGQRLPRAQKLLRRGGIAAPRCQNSAQQNTAPLGGKCLFIRRSGGFYLPCRIDHFGWLLVVKLLSKSWVRPS